ncbi:geranylgeranyl reductase family protein [uncultured Corynebacterium sp.]|uniref:geranylgeranyl reductase family protein n=1 Tax=uncultured Corynebacterium sp. TaxID=159447 RepID=UPI0028EC0137|nr:geranylgeranyl reductase family protein [uncultured Corynebacterium sp.]
MRRLRLATIVVVTDSTPTIHQPNNHGTKQRESRSIELLIIGAGPAGATAAIHAGRRGISTLLIDAQPFPRDKTCGDGLTPRAIHQLQLLGLADSVVARYRSHGLKLHGFGGSVTAPWPESTFGTVGSAMPRREFDNFLLECARSHSSVEFFGGVRAVSVSMSTPVRAGSGSIISGSGTVSGDAASMGTASVGASVAAVELSDGSWVRPKQVIVADGVRSPIGKLLGRTWHKGEVYGIAARSYCATPRSEEPWIHSHLELQDADGVVQPGYGWIFPLGNGLANVGCGALSTDRRPARINTKKLLGLYAQQCRPEWEFGAPDRVASALLPMGGAVSGVAGRNWMLIGDAAACVNPLNGEGIDYGMETARLAVECLDAGKDYTLSWPDVLRREYGEAFGLARMLARLLTYPQLLPMVGPVALRRPLGRHVMPVAARLMGNLITDADRDVVARLWHAAGRFVADRAVARSGLVAPQPGAARAFGAALWG